MNAIEARQIALKARRETLGKDLLKVKCQLEAWAKEGHKSMIFNATYSEHIDLIIHELRCEGYQARRTGRFLHAGYNQIEITW